MNEHNPVVNIDVSEKEAAFSLLSEIHKSPDTNQRDLAARLNFSLGKTNYLLRQLITKGLIKARGFSHNPGKINKVRYMLTKKGFREKVSLTYYFLKRKQAEYKFIKEEWKKLDKDYAGSII